MNSNILNYTVFDFVKNRSMINPKSVAIEDAKRPPMTYQQLENQIQYTVKILNERGLSRNDRVAIILPNGPEMAVAFLGVASCSTCAPINPSLKAEELTFFLKDMKAKALLTSSEADPASLMVADELGIKKILLKPNSYEAGVYYLDEETEIDYEEKYASCEDTALILYTSGTIARPKMVPLSHSNLCQSALNIAKSLELTENDRCLNVMPLFHIHGLIGCLLSSITVGAKIICTQGFQASNFSLLIQDLGPTWYSAVPTMHQSIISNIKKNQGEIKHSLRFIRSCSAALPPQLMTELEDYFRVPVVEAYGMTEASHQISINPLPPRRRKQRSVGLASGPEVSIINDYGKRSAKGELGEIVIRGQTVTKGYENNPEANVKAFTNGWFRTGDQGYIDKDNYIFITERIKEIINRGGEKISPREVDDVLLTHPAVKQAITFPLPDDRLGEEVVAAVILKENMNITEWEIQRYVSTKIADFKVPRRLFFIDDIPKGPTGKIQRKLMAQKLNITKTTSKNLESDAEYKEPTNNFEKGLVEIWSSILKLEKIGIRDNFFALGGDSLRAEEIVTEISEKYGLVNIPIVIFIHAPTIEKMAILLSSEILNVNSSLVCMQPDGDKSPLYLLHACGGEVVFFSNLVYHLGKERPIFAFRAPFLSGEKLPLRIIEDYAGRYLVELLEKQSKGPYNLAGAGPGGLIALEMAHHMKDKEVNIIILDAIHPKSPYNRKNIAYYLDKIHSYKNQIKISIMDRNLTKLSLIWLNQLFMNFVESRSMVNKVYMASKRYNPRDYYSPILLLAARTRRDYPDDPRIRINELKLFLKGTVEEYIITGEHLDILKEPNVEKVANIITKYLKK